MRQAADELQAAAEVAEALSDLGLRPILVGGMALVILGSQRVTRDFDFVIAQPGDRLARVLDVLYARGFELASRLSEGGDVIRTISNSRVAAIRLRIDAPASAHFFNKETAVRLDLLFDFPIAAATLAEHAMPTRVSGYLFEIASDQDLLNLKRIAQAARSSSRDVQDIEFLEARIGRSSGPTA